MPTRTKITRMFVTHAHDQTVALGRALGRRLDHGLTSSCCYGDLGSGKTAFAQGLANGDWTYPDVFAVTSPTYTLVNEYPGRLPFTMWIFTDCPNRWIQMTSVWRIFSTKTASWLSNGPTVCIQGDRPARPPGTFHFTVTGETVPVDPHNCIWT
jgi:hypothetical protein